jgi:hypothetical protein
LTSVRTAALAGATVAIAAYGAAAGYLWEASVGWDVAFLVLVVIPVTLLVPWLLLPYLTASGLLPVGLALAVLAVGLRVAELGVLFNLAKLFALVALGFWFLGFFENVAWAVLVAAVIPGVDALSVWRGPTGHIVEQQPGVFEDVSIAFRIPGEESTANLGPPDILFFALFLGAAERFGLRIAATWVAMTALLGLTLLLAATTDVAGLPALPAICIGFLVANPDLLWRALRRRGRAPVRIYGRTDALLYDLDADVVERTAGRVVLLTRERPPRTATVELGSPGRGELTLDDSEPVPVEVHELAHGLVVVPYDETPTLRDSVHPEQLAADDAMVERLKRERR